MLHGMHSAVISDCGDKGRVRIVLTLVPSPTNMRLECRVIFIRRRAGLSKRVYLRVINRYIGDCAAQETQSNGNVVVKNMAYIMLS